MKVKKAVIPAAGLGTRMLPASKAIPKEMLPIVDKPAIQYIVEEAAKSGIEDILIIVSRGKGAIADHFDRTPELEERLMKGGKDKELAEILGISELANISFVRQKEIKGLGHAVLYAESFVGNEPFAVLYGDDVILGENPATAELCETYEKYGLGVAGIKQVPENMIGKYSSLKVEKVNEDEYKISDMIEKPSPDKVLSLFSILGRVVLPPEIFGILKETRPGAGGEIQLTDAMKTLTYDKGMMGRAFSGKRYDMGNKFGVMQAHVETALTHPEIGQQFREYIKEIAKNL